MTKPKDDERPKTAVEYVERYGFGKAQGALVAKVKRLERERDRFRIERDNRATTADDLREMVRDLQLKNERLRVTVDAIRADAEAEITRRRDPGGLQAGVPRLAGVPMSVLQQLERDCRHALGEPITVFACGGKRCPAGGDHQWDGEVSHEDPDGGGSWSLACSKCGLSRLDFDLLNED